MIMTIIEYCVLALGILSTTISLWSANKFYRLPQNPLARPIAYTLIGEAVMGGLTSIFALLAVLGHYQLMPPLAASMMRVLMFSVAGMTTMKLVTTISALRRASRE